MSNEQDYIELGLSCGDVCQALDRGLDGRLLDDLNQPVLGAIGQLTAWDEQEIRRQNDSLTKCLNPRAAAKIQKQVIKQGKRNVVSRLLYAKNGKDAITIWRQDLNRILHIFNVRLIGPV